MSILRASLYVAALVLSPLLDIGELSRFPVVVSAAVPSTQNALSGKGSHRVLQQDGGEEAIPCTEALQQYRESNGENSTTVDIDECFESQECGDNNEVIMFRGSDISCNFSVLTTKRVWGDCETNTTSNSRDLGKLLTFPTEEQEWSTADSLFIGTVQLSVETGNYTHFVGVALACDGYVYLLSLSEDDAGRTTGENMYQVIGYQSLEPSSSSQEEVFVVNGTGLIHGEAISGVNPDFSDCAFGRSTMEELQGTCQATLTALSDTTENEAAGMTSDTNGGMSGENTTSDPGEVMEDEGPDTPSSTADGLDEDSSSKGNCSWSYYGLALLVVTVLTSMLAP